MISAKKVSISYGFGEPVLIDVSFSINEGDKIGVIAHCYPR